MARSFYGQPLMSSLTQDLRYAARVLLKSPAFTAVALATLALGIGVNTAIYSIVYTVLLKPLPYEAPERLVMLWGNSDTSRSRSGAASPADFLDWRSENTAFEDLAAINRAQAAYTGGGEPVRLEGAQASAGLFRILRVAPALGRVYTEQEDAPGAPLVVVLSDALWRERFDADPRLIGRPVTLDGEKRTVVGIMPPGFDFPRVATGAPVQFWMPFQWDRARAPRGGHYLGVVGRLRNGVTLAGAQAQMDAIAARLQKQYPETNTNWGIDLFSLHDEVVGDVGTALFVLVGAVTFVLLIACANVANLQLARASGRARELAVRAAVGAGQWRLLRQLLTESIVLSLAGSLLGVLLAAWTLEFASSMMAAWLPRAWEIGINAPVLAFTVVTALVTGVLFGIAPALHVTGVGAIGSTLKSGGRTTGSRGQQHLRTAFVVGEVALAFVLLIGAGLLLRSLQQLQNVRPGFQPDQTLTAVMSLPDARYPDIARQSPFTTTLLERVRRLPEIRSAALASFIPFDGKEALLLFDVDGEPQRRPGEGRLAQWRVVSDGFFETMGVPLLKGRTFKPSDTMAAPGVAVVSATLVKRFFPEKDPIGQRVTLDGLNGEQPPQWFTIVGVVDDVRFRRLTDPAMPVLYYPVAQQAFPEFTLVARAGGDPMAAVPSLRGIVRSLDASLPLTDVRTMDEVVSTSIAAARFRTTLLASFAVVALLLAAIGVYGVMSYSVEQRSQEMGLRMALGASPRNVLTLVTAHGVRLALAGILLGLVAAYAVTRVLESLLFGVSTTDPVTFAGIAVLLAAVASLAAYIPARRATRTDPMAVLRAE